MNTFRIKLLIYLWFFIAINCLNVDSAIIKVGNVLNIIVKDHAEFTGQFTVTKEGTLDYPLLADDPVINITTTELMNELTVRLAKYIENPLVLIDIEKIPPIYVNILGQIKKPGPVKTYRGASIQEIIQQAGGPTKFADLDRIKILHKQNNYRLSEFFNLTEFLKNGKIDDMPQLLEGDVIIVLSRFHDKRVKVIGAVNKPGILDIEETMSVFEIIYLAGGPADKADLTRVRRLFKSGNKTMEEVINIQEFMDKGEMDRIPIIEPGDVIIVYSKWFDWKAFSDILNNVLLFILTIQAIYGAIDK